MASPTPDRAAAVIDTLRFLASGWIVSDEDARWCLEAAEEIDQYDFDESAWTCPLCQEIACDDNCPLHVLRLGAWADA